MMQSIKICWGGRTEYAEHATFVVCRKHGIDWQKGRSYGIYRKQKTQILLLKGVESTEFAQFIQI